MFVMQDWWIIDMYCFFNELLVMVNIQVVEFVFVLGLLKEKLEWLYVEILKFNIFF